MSKGQNNIGESTFSFTPIHLMGFSKWILSIIGVIYVLAGLSEIIYPHNNVFETCKVILPMVATFVIGYYFGQLNKRKNETRNRTIKNI